MQRNRQMVLKACNAKIMYALFVSSASTRDMVAELIHNGYDGQPPGQG